MVPRRGLMEDLFEIGARLSWRVGLLAAAISAIGLHLLAAMLAPLPVVVGHPPDLGSIAARGMLYPICFFLQFLVPAGLLIGAGASFLKRGRGRTLY
jgi:restriction system protein